MTTDTENLDQPGIDDLDTPVDEALLMGEDADPEQSEQVDSEDQDKAAAEIDPDDLAKIAADDEDERVDEHKDDQKTVPQARFNQVYAEKKALEEELAVLRGQATADADKAKEAEKEVVTVKSLRDKEASIESELETALYEGDSDKTKELRAQLRELRGQMDDLVITEAESRAEKRIEGKREIEAFKSLAASLEEKYPVLNGETGDPEAIALVVELRDAYIAKGMPMTQALKTAVEKIAPRFAKAEEKPADKEEGKPDARNVTAITRGAKDSNRIPPSEGGVGNRALTPKDVNDYTVDEWEKLPQSEREKILAA